MLASLNNKSYANITVILKWLTNYKKFKSCVDQGRGLPTTQAGTHLLSASLFGVMELLNINKPQIQSLVGACSVMSLCNPMNCSPPGSCPRNFPGKNTGVGCHFLLQGMFPAQSSKPKPLASLALECKFGMPPKFGGRFFTTTLSGKISLVLSPAKI